MEYTTNNGICTLCLSNGNENLSAVLNITEEWSGAELIARNGLAFNHAKIIEYAIEKLRRKFKSY